MSDYKLVPVEPTPEMMKAFCVASKAVTTEEWEDPLYADQVADVLKNMPPAYRAMLAAAPAVQMEVVGWQFYEDGKWWYGDDRIKVHRKNTEEAGYPTRDVYAASQPAEQQPDVAQLVEALEAAYQYMQQREVLVDSEWDHCRDFPTLERHGDLHSSVVIVHEALAAYRKGGEK